MVGADGGGDGGDGFEVPKVCLVEVDIGVGWIKMGSQWI